MRSGIILAGGRSTRFGGGDKALKPIGGTPMICRVQGSLESVVDEIVISVRDEQQRDMVFPLLKGARAFVYDRQSDFGPLAGIEASLKAARGEYVFIVACDMPYVNPKVVELLFDEAKGHDAAVPRRENGYIEPLHAVYRRQPLLAEVEAAVGAGERQIIVPLRRLKDVVYVPVEKIAVVDPGLKTFLNVNRAEDMPAD